MAVLSQTLSRDLRSHDKHYVVKLIAYSLIVFFAFLSMMLLIAPVFYGSWGASYISVFSYIVLGLEFLYNLGFNVIYPLVRRKPIHPGWNVAVPIFLLPPLMFFIVVFLANSDSYFVYSRGRSTAPWLDNGSSDEKNALLAASVFMCFEFFVGFVFWIWACVDTHRVRREEYSVRWNAAMEDRAQAIAAQWRYDEQALQKQQQPQRPESHVTSSTQYTSVPQRNVSSLRDVESPIPDTKEPSSAYQETMSSYGSDTWRPSYKK